MARWYHGGMVPSPQDLLSAHCGPDGFSARVALGIVRIAGAVYSDRAAADAAAAGWEIAQGFEIGNSQGMIAAAPGVVVFANRGTGEARDWLDNVRTWRTTPAWMSGGPWRVHAGFARQAERIAYPMLEAFANAYRHAGPGSRVFGVGHSLGAPAAQMLAAEICEANLYVGQLDVYAINGPRWLEHVDAIRWGARYLGGISPMIRLRRVVSTVGGELDLVSRAPPERWGFDHVGELVILDGARRFSGNNARARWSFHRKLSPVGNLAAFRILSRAVRGIEAHAWTAAAEALAAQPDAEGATP